MLHFLIGTALCIWIAERIAHFVHLRKQRQYDRMVARMLSTTPHEPELKRAPLYELLPSLTVAAVVVVVLIIASLEAGSTAQVDYVVKSPASVSSPR